MNNFEVIAYSKKYSPHIVGDDGKTNQIQKHYEEKGYTTKLKDSQITYVLLDIIQDVNIKVIVYPECVNKIIKKLTLEESNLVLQYKRNQEAIQQTEKLQDIKEQIKYL